MQKLANIIPIKNVSENSILTSLSITRGIKWIELMRRPLPLTGGNRRSRLDQKNSNKRQQASQPQNIQTGSGQCSPSTIRGERDRRKRREGGDVAWHESQRIECSTCSGHG